MQAKRVILQDKWATYTWEKLRLFEKSAFLYPVWPKNSVHERNEDAAEGPDVALTGTALEQASAAALAYLGEGHVTGTEVGDEEGCYEVEVTLDNGHQVNVHLDENFNVLGQLEDNE